MNFRLFLRWVWLLGLFGPAVGVLTAHDRIRPDVRYDTRTKTPRFIGVRQLTTPDPGKLPTYYQVMSFEGGSDYAKTSSSVWNPYEQKQTLLSGSITYAIDPATEKEVATSTAVAASGVVKVRPWPSSAEFGQPPVLSTAVPATTSEPITNRERRNNPFDLTVRGPDLAADDNVFRFAVFGGWFTDEVEWQNYRVMRLSSPDSAEAAVARAKWVEGTDVREPTWITTIGGTAAYANPEWTIREVKVLARLLSSFCSNDVVRIAKYSSRALGSSEWKPWRTIQTAVTLQPAALGAKLDEFSIPRVDGLEIRLDSLEYESAECAKCSSGDTLPGGGFGPRRGSVKWDIPLGSDAYGRGAGYLRLHAERVSDALYSPAALAPALREGGAELLTDGTGAVRQILAPQVFVDVVTLSPSRYELRIYRRDQAGMPDPQGLRVATGAPAQLWRVENPGEAGSGRLRVTRLVGATDVVTEIDDSVPERTVFSEANGLRVTEISRSVENGDRVETAVVRDASGAIASVVKTFYRSFPWGEERVKEIVDPAGAARTTEWQFNTAENSAAYRRVRAITRPEGHVESFEFDYSGRIRTEMQRFVRDWEVRLVTEEFPVDADKDGLKDYVILTTQAAGSSVLNRVHAIDYAAEVTIDGQRYRRRELRRAWSGGNNEWHDPANIVTRQRIRVDGPFAGEVAYQLNPDGTLLLRRSSVRADGFVVLEEEAGAADSARETVVDGTRTTKILNLSGAVVSSSVVDIASGVVTESTTVGKSDEWGRPLRVLHLDGAEELISYCGSCGSVEQRTLRGESTSFEYDALGRKVLETQRVGGVVVRAERYEYDAADRLTKIWREHPTTKQQTLLSSREYDLAGRLIAEFELGRGKTTRRYASGSGYTTITTITSPDGGTRVEQRAPDGTLVALSGTTVAPVEYWWRSPAPGSPGGYIVHERRIHANDRTVTTQTLFNLVGELQRVTYPDEAQLVRQFDEIGRPVRETEPDGITTLFAYDARGRRAVVAVDVNRNGRIDFDGSDRITQTREEVGTRDGKGVRRSITETWEIVGQDRPTQRSVAEESFDGRSRWMTEMGLTTSTLVDYDEKGGSTATTTYPDGTREIVQTFGGRTVSLRSEHPDLGTLRSTTYEYDELNRLVAETDARNGRTSYRYDEQDRVIGIILPDPDSQRSEGGNDAPQTSMEYDVMGRVVVTKMPDGQSMFSEYHPSGLLTRSWGARTYPVEYTYDAQLRLKTLTTWQNFSGDSGRATTTWNYDELRGWLVNKRYADNTGPTYSYTRAGRLQKRTWARGVATTYGYGAGGELITIEYSDATPDVSYEYDRAGRVVRVTDGVGVRSLRYNEQGLLEREAHDSGQLAGWEVGRAYDSLQRETSVALKQGGVTQSEVGAAYDGASRLSRLQFGANSAHYRYLATSPLVESVELRSDGQPRLASTRTYDRLNRLASIVHAAAAPVASHTYVHNAADQRVAVVREDGSRWSYGYDLLGQVTSAEKAQSDGTPLPGHRFRYAYDDIGNRQSATTFDPKGARVSTYTDNALNQYTERTVPGVAELLVSASPGAVVTYQRPPKTGRPQPMPAGAGGLRHDSWEVDNRSDTAWEPVGIMAVRPEAGPRGEDIVSEEQRLIRVPKTPEQFSYDADGNLLSDAQWKYTWDAENRLTAMETSDRVPGTEGLRGEYFNSFDLSGTPVLRREEAIDFWYNGSPGPGVNADFSARWTGFLIAPTTGTYTFRTQNDDGVRLWVDGKLLIDDWRNGSPRENTSAPLVLEAGKRYPIKLEFYDSLYGAVLKFSWKVPSASGYVSVPLSALRGSQVDGFGVSVTNRRLEFAYDAGGRRTTKKTYTAAGSAWAQTSERRFLYDGWNLLGELAGAGTAAPGLSRTYAWGLDLSGTRSGAGGVGGLVFTRTHGAFSGTYAALADGNGNITAYADATTGQRVARYEYSPFGETILSEDPNELRFAHQFSSKYYDAESDALYYGFRYYSPGTGRWINRDPIEEQGGINLYGFVYNNSLYYFDSDGRGVSSLDSPTGAAVMADLESQAVMQQAAREGAQVLAREAAARAAAAAAAATAAGALSGDTPQKCPTCSGGPNPASRPAQAPFRVATPGAKLTSDQERQKQQERKAYKRRCTEMAPPGLDRCERLQWLLQRNKDCRQMRTDFGKKWFGDNEPGHAQAIQELEAAIGNLEDNIKRYCQPCPSRAQQPSSTP